MTPDAKIRSAVLGGGLVVLLAMASCEQAASPDELARQALHAPTARQQQEAVARLAECGKDARGHLQRVMAQSQSSQVRAVCIQALAVQWDYDSIPAFLDALDDRSETVRGQAVRAVERLLSKDLAQFGYRYDDPPGKRARAIQRIRQDWERTRDSPIMKSWRKRLKKRS